MADKVWRMPTEKPLDSAAVYDGLRLHEVVLRFPNGAKSGGEVQVARLRGEVTRELVTVPFEPGEPDALRDVLAAFLAPILARAGVMGEDATLQDAVAPVVPKVVEKPMGTL